MRCGQGERGGEGQGGKTGALSDECACADALNHLFAVRRGGGHRIRHQQDVEAVPTRKGTSPRSRACPGSNGRPSDEQVAPVDGVEGGGGDAIVRPRPEQHDRVDAPRLRGVGCWDRGGEDRARSEGEREGRGTIRWSIWAYK